MIITLLSAVLPMKLNKDTDALDAAIKQILKADVEGIEKYWDLDESKRTKQTWHQFII